MASQQNTQVRRLVYAREPCAGEASTTSKNEVIKRLERRSARPNRCSMARCRAREVNTSPVLHRHLHQPPYPVGANLLRDDLRPTPVIAPVRVAFKQLASKLAPTEIETILPCRGVRVVFTQFAQPRRGQSATAPALVPGASAALPKRQPPAPAPLLSGRSQRRRCSFRWRP